MNHEEFWSQISAKDEISLLFICTGNICRSPFAELLFKHLLFQSNVPSPDRFKIRSGGFVIQSIPIHEFSKQTLSELGVDETSIDAFHSRNLRMYKQEMEQADFLIVMDTSNRDTMVPAKYRFKTILLSEIAVGEEKTFRILS